MKRKVPDRVRNGRRSANSSPVEPNEIKKPDIVEPIAFLIDSSSQHSDAFLVDDVEGMFFPGTWLIIVGVDEFPFLELNVKVLSSFSHHIDERKRIIEGSMLVLTTKAEDTFVF